MRPSRVAGCPEPHEVALQPYVLLIACVSKHLGSAFNGHREKGGKYCCWHFGRHYCAGTSPTKKTKRRAKSPEAKNSRLFVVDDKAREEVIKQVQIDDAVFPGGERRTLQRST